MEIVFNLSHDLVFIQTNTTEFSHLRIGIDARYFSPVSEKIIWLFVRRSASRHDRNDRDMIYTPGCLLAYEMSRHTIATSTDRYDSICVHNMWSSILDKRCSSMCVWMHISFSHLTQYPMCGIFSCTICVCSCVICSVIIAYAHTRFRRYSHTIEEKTTHDTHTLLCTTFFSFDFYVTRMHIFVQVPKHTRTVTNREHRGTKNRPTYTLRWNIHVSVRLCVVLGASSRKWPQQQQQQCNKKKRAGWRWLCSDRSMHTNADVDRIVCARQIWDTKTKTARATTTTKRWLISVHTYISVK